MMSDESGPSQAKARKTEQQYESYINFNQLFLYTRTRDECVQFCQHFGLLPKSILCPSCGATLSKIVEKSSKSKSRAAEDTNSLLFRCHKKGCDKKVSINKNTWFAQTKLPYRKSLLLVYCFLERFTYDQAVRETSGPLYGGVTTSRESVADLFSYCREVILDSFLEQKEARKIGGKNCIVEVDEAKFGKRKYNRGRVVEGQWVFGGICRESKEVFFVPVSDRTEETLLGIIEERVEAGTTIHSDCFKSYGKLAELGFVHKTVNHSQNFVDPESGAHTNTIESTWWAVKRHLRSSHTQKDYFVGHLAEYCWHRKHAGSQCKFLDFLADIARLYPGSDA